MDTATAQATLTDANTRMTVLSNRMEELRAEQLQVLRQAQAIANEPGVRQAISVVGTFPTTAKRHYLYLPEGASTIQALRLGKQKHIKELMLPLCEAGEWAASRPSSESWLVASASLTTAKELFNESSTPRFLGI